MIIARTPAIPAYIVIVSVASPKLAPTVLLDISVSFAGRLPELIKSTKLLASSSVKLP